MERACPCCSKGYLETEWQAVMFPARSVGSVGIEEARGFTLGEVVRTRSGGMCAQLRCVHDRAAVRGDTVGLGTPSLPRSCDPW